MKRKRRREAPGKVPNHERWLVSYADFITLLFAFFVVMFATSQVDKRKMNQLSVAIQSAFQQWGGTAVAVSDVNLLRQSPVESPVQDQGDLDELKRELGKALAPEISRHEVALHSEADGLVISLREVGFFESGSPALKANSRSAFNRMVKVLSDRTYSIRIEGHTDNVPIHNAQFASNWELSTARATDLVRLLVIQYAFLPEKLSAAGYAEYHPVASNATEQGRAMNRRLDVVVLHKPLKPPDASERPESPSASPANP
jgi:chemotaxis protein MotB